MMPNCVKSEEEKTAVPNIHASQLSESRELLLLLSPNFKVRAIQYIWSSVWEGTVECSIVLHDLLVSKRQWGTSSSGISSQHTAHLISSSQNEPGCFSQPAGPPPHTAYSLLYPDQTSSPHLTITTMHPNICIADSFISCSPSKFSSAATTNALPCQHYCLTSIHPLQLCPLTVCLA